MKTKITMTVALGLIAPVFALTIVLAQDSGVPGPGPGTGTGTGSNGPGAGTGSGSTTTTTTNTTTTTTQPQPTVKTQQQQELSQRIEKRKAEFKTKLTTTQQKRIQAGCKAAQAKLNGALTHTNAVDVNRIKIHDKLINRFNEVEAKLKASNIDTTELKAQIAVLQTKIDTYKADVAAYKQAVADTKDLDCSADPTAFKASLEAARANLAKLKADAADIRNHVNHTLKPVLVALKVQLAQTKQEDN